MTWKYHHSEELLKLVRQFPLALINSRLQHEQALKVLHDLILKSKLTAAETDYFQVLSGLIQNYESVTYSASSATPQQVLEFLMEQNQLGQADISKITNVHPPHISEFLAGRRNIPKHAAAKLGGYFKVDPSVFLPRVSPAESPYTIPPSAGQLVSESTQSPYKVAGTGKKATSTKRRANKSADSTRPKRTAAKRSDRTSKGDYLLCNSLLHNCSTADVHRS